MPNSEAALNNYPNNAKPRWGCQTVRQPQIIILTRQSQGGSLKVMPDKRCQIIESASILKNPGGSLLCFASHIIPESDAASLIQSEAALI